MQNGHFLWENRSLNVLDSWGFVYQNHLLQFSGDLYSVCSYQRSERINQIGIEMLQNGF